MDKPPQQCPSPAESDAAIHHFCDRWCEHCPATARCAFFRRIEQPLVAAGRTVDERNLIRFTDGLAAHFATLIRLWKEASAQLNDRAPAPPTGSVRPKPAKPGPTFRRGDPLRQEAQAYWTAARAFRRPVRSGALRVTAAPLRRGGHA